MQTIDVESLPVEEGEAQQEKAPQSSCQLFAHEGKIYVKLGDSCYAFSPQLASAYGLTMLLMAYLQDRRFEGAELGPEEINQALKWALDNHSRLTADSSSIRFIDRTDGQPGV